MTGRNPPLEPVFRVVDLDQMNQRLLAHNCLPLNRDALALGAIPGSGLVIITESELLTDNEP